MTSVLLTHALKSVLKDARTSMAVKDLKLAVLQRFGPMEFGRHVEDVLRECVAQGEVIAIGENSQHRYAWAS